MALLVGGCNKGESHGGDPTALVKGADSAELSKYLPPDGVDGYSRTKVVGSPDHLTCTLIKDGDEVARIELSDYSENSSIYMNSSLQEKLQMSDEKVAGHPWVNWTGHESVLLVNKKYGISVDSPKLDMAAQKALMAKFDLKGLAKL